MRDLVFKNLTSQDKKRKVISRCEVKEESGVKSEVRQHFICAIYKVSANSVPKRSPERVYIHRNISTLEQKQCFFCRVKDDVYFTHKGNLYMAKFCHSLKIKSSLIKHS